MRPSLRIALLLACVTGCTSSPTSTGIATVTCPTDSTLTYENFGSAFMTDNCLSCHTSQEQPHLNTQALIQTNASRILQEAVYTNAMPQDGDLTTAERQTLGEWLACGAP